MLTKFRPNFSIFDELSICLRSDDTVPPIFNGTHWLVPIISDRAFNASASMTVTTMLASGECPTSTIRFEFVQSLFIPAQTLITVPLAVIGQSGPPIDLETQLGLTTQFIDPISGEQRSLMVKSEHLLMVRSLGLAVPQGNQPGFELGAIQLVGRLRATQIGSGLRAGSVLEAILRRSDSSYLPGKALIQAHPATTLFHDNRALGEPLVCLFQPRSNLAIGLNSV